MHGNTWDEARLTVFGLAGFCDNILQSCRGALARLNLTDVKDTSKRAVLSHQSIDEYASARHVGELGSPSVS